MSINTALKRHIPTLISLWRKKNNSSPLNQNEINRIAKNLVELQRGLTGSRKLAGKTYMDNDDTLGAYLLYYWPVTYMQISAVLYPLKKYLTIIEEDCKKQNRPLKILDIGSGPTPASVSILDNITAKDIQVSLIDHSDKALTLAKKIINTDYKNVSVASEKSNIESRAFTTIQGEYDIIVMSHVLNELYKNQKDAVAKRKEFLDSIMTHMGESTLLIINEPAILESSRNLIKIRDLLNDTVNILSPCVHAQNKTQCPALKAGENHTCHQENTWSPIAPVSDLAKQAGLDRTSVKMTCFVFSKTEQNAINENLYRVVSDAMLNKAGRIRYLLCNSQDRIAFSAKKDDTLSVQKGFFALKRGTVINLTNPQLRGDKENKAYGIKEDTQITVIEKPLVL